MTTPTTPTRKRVAPPPPTPKKKLYPQSLEVLLLDPDVASLYQSILAEKGNPPTVVWLEKRFVIEGASQKILDDLNRPGIGKDEKKRVITLYYALQALVMIAVLMLPSDFETRTFLINEMKNTLAERPRVEEGLRHALGADDRVAILNIVDHMASFVQPSPQLGAQIQSEEVDDTIIFE